MIRLQSFDVFDTLVGRRTSRPSDVFLLLYRLLGESARFDLQHLDEYAFLAARRQSEKHARLLAHQDGRDECTLEEIWTCLVERLPEFSVSIGMELELKAERELIYPLVEQVEKVRAARLAGHRICFLSDMYLPASFIRDILLGFGIAKDEDALYVSGDWGRSKSTGRLYRTMLDEFGVAADEVIHHGDNLRADVAVPRELGFCTRFAEPHHVKRGPGAVSTHPGLERLERSVLQETLHAMSAQDVPVKAPTDSLVHHFLGPVCVLWAIWVLQQAERVDARQLHFIARDTCLLYQAARWLVKHFDLPFDCHYLEVSRNVLAPAAIQTADPGLLREWLFPDWERIDVERALQRAELLGVRKTEPVLRWAKTVNTASMLSNEDREQLLSMLCSWKVAPEMLKHTAAALKQLETYLQQQQMFSDSVLFTCDIGWTLRSQAMLKSLVAPKRSLACNLLLNERRLLHHEAGPAIAMLGQLPGQDDRRFMKQELGPFAGLGEPAIEALLGQAPCGTVKGYRLSAHGIEPVYGRLSEAERVRRIRVGQELEGYLDAHAARLYRVFRQPDQCVAGMRALTDHFLLHPPAEAVEALRHLTLSVRLEDDPTDQLVSPYSWREAAREWLPERLGGKVAQRLWPAGSRMATAKSVRTMLDARRVLSGVRGAPH